LKIAKDAEYGLKSSQRIHKALDPKLARIRTFCRRTFSKIAFLLNLFFLNDIKLNFLILKQKNPVKWCHALVDFLQKKNFDSYATNRNFKVLKF